MAIPFKVLHLAEVISHIVVDSATCAVAGIEICSREILAKRLLEKPSLMKLAEDIVAAFDGLPIESYDYESFSEAIYGRFPLDLKIHLFIEESGMVEKFIELDDDVPTATFRFPDGSEYVFPTLLPDPVLFDLK